MLRLFVAIEIPAALKQRLADRTAAVRGDRAVRWVDSRALHLTLKFLGDTPTERVPELVSTLDRIAAAHPPLALRLDGLGTFPRRGPPRVLWVGLEGDLTALGALSAELEAGLEPLGFTAETRPFHPHVTLGRVRRGNPRGVTAALADLGDLGGFVAEALVLFQSELHPQGALHTELASSPLRAQVPHTTRADPPE